MHGFRFVKSNVWFSWGLGWLPPDFSAVKGKEGVASPFFGSRAFLSLIENMSLFMNVYNITFLSISGGMKWEKRCLGERGEFSTKKWIENYWKNELRVPAQNTNFPWRKGLNFPNQSTFPPNSNSEFSEIELKQDSVAEKGMLFEYRVSPPFDTPLKSYRKWSYLITHGIWSYNRRFTTSDLDRPPPGDVAQFDDLIIESTLKKLIDFYELSLIWQMCQILQALGIPDLQSDFRSLK